MNTQPESEKFLGVLSLDTSFPRIAGDVGNPESYSFPTRVRIVEGADSPEIVRDGAPSDSLLAKFAAATVELEREGAGAIISTCGFLISAQAFLAERVSIPVMLSALSLYPIVKTACPGRVGILTASSGALGPKALEAAGIDPGHVVIEGMDHDTVFAGTFLVTRKQQARTLNREAMEMAVCNAARRLCQRDGTLSAILLECGNLPPYAEAVRRTTSLPVFDLVDGAHLLMAASRGRIRDPHNL